MGGRCRTVVSCAEPDVEQISSSPHAEGTGVVWCGSCQSKISKQQDARGKKRKRENFPDTNLHDVLRPHLVDSLAAHWETLKVDGRYDESSVERFQWILEGGPAHVHRLHHHLTLRQL